MEIPIKKMNDIKLQHQEITVGEGWQVTYNTLTNLDPENNDIPQEEFEKAIIFILTEDLVQIYSKDQLIDIGWTPDCDPEGKFGLQLLERTEEGANWRNPLYEFETRSLAALLAEIKRLTTGTEIDSRA